MTEPPTSPDRKPDRPPDTHVHEPVAQPDPPAYVCSDCLTPTPATEVHAIGGGTRVAYCAACAPTWRPHAHVVMDTALAHALGITVTA